MNERIILDTNCLLVITPKRSQFRWLYDRILNGDLELAITTEILLEYEEQLTFFYSSGFAENVIKTLINLPNVIKVNPISFNWLLIPDDADDDKFVDSYVASNADVLITNDRHYNILKTIAFPEINIIKLTEYPYSE